MFSQFARQFRLSAVLVASVLMPAPQALAQQTFEEFQAQQNQGLEDFETSFEARFAAYVETFQQELAAYEAELREHWAEPLTSDQHRWVAYRDGNRSRTVVDYEQNKIVIEVAADSTGDANAEALVILDELLTKDLATAQQEDEVVRRTEAEMALDGTPESTPAASEPVLSEVSAAEARVMVAERQAEPRVEAASGGARNVVAITIPLPPSRTSQKAAEFMTLIEQYAGQYDQEPALMLAIMHSESSFNPMARSHIPAFGLMQIVPQSAGRDVTQELYGEAQVMPSSYYFDPENNVRAGAIYLDILMSRYLRRIDHPESRLYAAVSAYNTGAGNVARAFTGNTNISQAARIINQMSPDAVYEHLVNNLPYDETRNYLRHVVGRQVAYRDGL